MNRFSGVLFLIPVADNLDAGAHGGCKRDALDVLALDCSGSCLDDRINKCVVVGQQLLFCEGSLADRAVDDVGLVQSVLDLTCFDIVDCLGNI